MMTEISNKANDLVIIAELEAEIDMLKQLSQPIEFWSDEKIQIYKSNESRTMKSGYEEREE